MDKAQHFAMSDLLNQPLAVTREGVVQIKNKIAKSAMSEALGDARGNPTQALSVLYRRWAQGGAGLLITGNIMVDRHALGEHGNVILDEQSDLASFQAWTAAGTKNGVQLWAQLNHPGKQAPKGLNRENIAPSAVAFEPHLQAYFAQPRAMTAQEVEGTIDQFVQSAKLAKDVGFTGVQIHGAHGYLVSQFLSPHHNRRTDQWGGSAANRRRFVLEILRRMRERVGVDFPIAIKLNSADFQRGGFDEQESMDCINALVEAGIDLIEISGGTYEKPVMTGAVANLT